LYFVHGIAQIEGLPKDPGVKDLRAQRGRKTQSCLLLFIG